MQLMMTIFHDSYCVFFLCIAIIFCVSQREEILASRKRRAKQLETMLDDARERLRDHEKKIRLLTEDEKAALIKKIDIYQRKLDTMTGELDEREVDRILKREQLRNERLKERRQRRSEL
jgi:hypothetical protein